MDLRGVADIKADPMRLWQPALMLRAFAIECLFKALWLREPGNKLAQNGKWIRIQTCKNNNHDLECLARAVGFELTSPERNVLTRLTFFGVWGRYPIVKNYSEHQGRSIWTTDDEFVCDNITERLSKLLE